MDQDALIALYENKRLLVLNTFITHPQQVESALAFAYYHRLAPIFHEDIARETYERDPYAEIYAVKADFMNAVTKYIDGHWLGKTLDHVEFYELEGHFGGRDARIALIHTIEYARIGRRFDDEVYAAIQRNAPMEANNLESKFEPKDVYLY